jgi:hypothetical protein
VAKGRARRAKLGPPLTLDDQTLDTLARVSDADVPAAEAFMRDASGQKAVDLLRAAH